MVPTRTPLKAPEKAPGTPEELVGDSKLNSADGKLAKASLKAPTKGPAKAPANQPVTPEEPVSDSKLSTANGKPTKGPAKAPTKTPPKSPASPDEPARSPMDFTVALPDVSPQGTTEVRHFTQAI